MTTCERYNLTNESRGKALILNNVNFWRPWLKDRPESDRDAARLKAAFESIGFAKDNIQVERNKTTVEMEMIVENCMKWKEHANSDCFVCVILSHGDNEMETTPDGRQRVLTDHVFGTDGSMPLKNLMKIVQDCEALDGKPKIFIVQGCRGKSVSEPVSVKEPVLPPKRLADSSPTPPESGISETEEASVDAAPIEPRYEDEEHALPHDIPVGKDCLLLYATQPGFFAFKQPTGSPFIDHFCKQVENNKDSDIDFLSLLTRVNHDVAFEYESKVKGIPGLNKKKMMPWIASRLTKDVVFGRVNK